MDTKSAISEFQSISKEIAIRTAELKKLRTRLAFLDKNISSYLEDKKLPGVKCNSISVQFDERKGRERKKKEDKKKDALAVLSQSGISNPERILKQINDAQRGQEVVVKKLKLINK